MTTTQDNGEDLMDVRDVARRLKVPVRYVYRLVAERRIPFVKIGHLLRFKPSDVDKWIEQLGSRRSARLHLDHIGGPPDA